MKAFNDAPVWRFHTSISPPLIEARSDSDWLMAVADQIALGQT